MATQEIGSETTQILYSSPFCWQGKYALELIRKSFVGVERAKMLSLYTTLTWIASDKGNEPIANYTKVISEYSGLNIDWIPSAIEKLDNLELIVTSNKRNADGKFSERLLRIRSNMSGPAVQTVAPVTPVATKPLVSQDKPTVVATVKQPIVKQPIPKQADEQPSLDFNDPRFPNMGKSKVQNVVSGSEWGTFEGIFKYASDSSVFNTTYPKAKNTEDTIKVSKTVAEAVDTMQRIKNGTFVADYSLDFPTYDADNWEDQMYKALDIFKRIQTDPLMWPTDKTRLPKSLSAFLINKYSGYSWFVKCLCPVAFSVVETSDKAKQLAVHFKTWWTDSCFELADSQEQALYKNMDALVITHLELWETYGQYYDKKSNWRSYLGDANPDMFIKVYAEYLKKYSGSPHAGKTAPTSASFASFKAFLHNEYGFNLNLSASDLASLKKSTEPKVVKRQSKPYVLPSLTAGVISGSNR